MRAAACLALLLIAPVVGGCSFALGLRLASAGSTPAFDREKRRCVTGFRVSTGHARYAQNPGDPESRDRRVVWAVRPVADGGRDRCLRFPITYGRAAPGAIATQPPAPLIPGIVYVASADGAFNAGHTLFFAIRDGRIVEVERWPAKDWVDRP